MTANDQQQDELSRDLIEAIVRSARAKAPYKTLMLRVERVAREKHGVTHQPTVEFIDEQIALERRTGKGRQKRTEYNEPPMALQRRFEAVHAGTVVPGTKKGAPASVRYKLTGPVERYKTDFTADEIESFTRAMENGADASRQNVTSNYGEGGGGGGNRSGGVIDRHRLAYTAHQHDLSQMPREWWPVFHRLIESGITVIEIGRWILPGVTDERLLRGAGRAAQRMIAQQIKKIETERRGLERGERPDRRMIDQIRREKQERRERVSP